LVEIFIDFKNTHAVIYSRTLKRSLPNLKFVCSVETCLMCVEFDLRLNVYASNFFVVRVSIFFPNDLLQRKEKHI
jgi:hypothetical protein